MNLPFMGERMTCVMCGKQQQSDPAVESQWRAITVDGQTFHVCPKHFPPDGSSARKFQQAYEKVLRHILNLLQQPRAN